MGALVQTVKAMSHVLCAVSEGLPLENVRSVNVFCDLWDCWTTISIIGLFRCSFS